jgi:FkbM family methyltransferase
VANPLLGLAAVAARLLPNAVKQALYRLGPVSNGLRAALNRAAPQGLTESVVAGGGLRGARLLLNLQTEKDYWLGTYEPELQQAFADLLQPEQTVYDCGANIGYLSLLAARQVGLEGRVFAFEALPANRERLQANLALNAEGQPVEVVAKAVAASSGSHEFLAHASGGMGKLAGSAGRDEAYSERIMVEAIALDDFVYGFGHPPPDLIKLDIEGGEGGALQGMPRLLAEARPRLLIELHGPEAAKHVWERLIAAEYQLHRMIKGYPAVHSLDDLDWKAYVMALAKHG